MSESCIQCSSINRTNQHKLKPFLLSINYESVDIITSLELPRKYTSAYNDISIGTSYNNKILQHDDVIKRQNHIIGEWLRKDNKLEIYLNVIVSSKQNPDAESRNKMFCDKLGLVLESIAFAETSLLKSHPYLDATKIFVRFHSLDPKYDRTEYWHRLGYWVVDSMRDHSEIPSSKVNHEGDYSHKYVDDSNNKFSKDIEIIDKNRHSYKDTEIKDKKKYKSKPKPREICKTCPRYNTPNFIL